MALKSGKFLAHTVTLEHKGEKQLVFTQDIQFHPVTDLPVHLDLFRVEKRQQIKVNVPARFTGEGVSPGIKRGGALNIVRHEIELVCPAGAIPEELIFDVSALDIGDSIRISAVTLPANMRPTITDRDFTVATISGRRAKDDAEDTAKLRQQQALPPKARLRLLLQRPRPPLRLRRPLQSPARRRSNRARRGRTLCGASVVRQGVGGSGLRPMPGRRSCC